MEGCNGAVPPGRRGNSPIEVASHHAPSRHNTPPASPSLCAEPPGRRSATPSLPGGQRSTTAPTLSTLGVFDRGVAKSSTTVPLVAGVQRPLPRGRYAELSPTTARHAELSPDPAPVPLCHAFHVTAGADAGAGAPLPFPLPPPPSTSLSFSPSPLLLLRNAFVILPHSSASSSSASIIYVLALRIVAFRYPRLIEIREPFILSWKGCWKFLRSRALQSRNGDFRGIRSVARAGDSAEGVASASARPEGSAKASRCVSSMACASVSLPHANCSRRAQGTCRRAGRSPNWHPRPRPYRSDVRCGRAVSGARVRRKRNPPIYALDPSCA